MDVGEDIAESLNETAQSIEERFANDTQGIVRAFDGLGEQMAETFAPVLEDLERGWEEFEGFFTG